MWVPRGERGHTHAHSTAGPRALGGGKVSALQAKRDQRRHCSRRSAPAAQLRTTCQGQGESGDDLSAVGKGELVGVGHRAIDSPTMRTKKAQWAASASVLSVIQRAEFCLVRIALVDVGLVVAWRRNGVRPARASTVTFHELKNCLGSGAARGAPGSIGRFRSNPAGNRALGSAAR